MHRHDRRQAIACKVDGCRCRQYVSQTRARILAVLASNGATSAEVLAREAGVALSTLRGHLHRLQRDQMVGVDFVPLGMGRPKLFAWLPKTPRASSLPSLPTFSQETGA